MLTMAAIPSAQAADATQTSAAIGFEDGNIYAIGGSKCDREITTDTPDGSAKALKVTTTDNVSSLGLILKLKEGQKYEISAKIKPLECPTGFQAGMKVWLLQKSGNQSLQLSTLSGDEVLTMDKWSTVSGVLTSKGTEDGTFELRFGRHNNNNNGCRFVIDDITISPVKDYVVDINFDGSKIDNLGTSGTSVMDATTYEYFNRRNGQAIRFNNIANQNALIRINNVLLKPNTTYKITYDIAQLKGNCTGKVIRLGISRGGYHKASDGSDAKKQIENATSSLYKIPGTGWQKVTQYIKTSNPRIFNEVGYCNMFFEFFADESCTTRLSGDESLRFEMDNFKIEELDVPMGAFFELGQLPDYDKNAESITYNAEDNTLDVTVTSGADLQFGVGIDNGAEYVLSYDVKGTEGMTIQPLLLGKIDDSIGKNESNGPTTLNGEWQHCTWKFTYACDPIVYPQLLIRSRGNTGKYTIKNIKCVRKSSVTAYTGNKLTSGQTAAIAFSDYAENGNGYVYSIYAKNSADEKIIYASGMTTQKAVNYKVSAPAGTVLYASVAAIGADNSQSAFSETMLGTVEAVKEFAIRLAINHDADEMPTGGSAVIENDGQPRTLRLFFAQYNGSTLVDVTSETFNIAAGEDNTFTVNAELADNLDSVRLFAWDGNGTPYTAAIEE